MPEVTTWVRNIAREHLKSNDDSKEKELMGNLWASKSKELEFLMLYEGEYKEALRGVLS